MSDDSPLCKITVLKRILHQDLAVACLEEQYQGIELCDRFEEGQEFLVTDLAEPPQGFCAWAWADIRHDLLTVAYGGDVPGMKEPGTAVSGCTDWFRPVIFKVERMA